MVTVTDDERLAACWEWSSAPGPCRPRTTIRSVTHFLAWTGSMRLIPLLLQWRDSKSAPREHQFEFEVDRWGWTVVNSGST